MKTYTEVRPLIQERVAKLAHNISISKLCSGVSYGAAASIYKPITVAAMELSSPQCLLLALLNSLVTGDVMSCLLLANVCLQVQLLHSKYLKVWLKEDFLFPRQDMEKAMSLLSELETAGLMKLPSHVLEIMYYVASKYGITNIQFQEGGCNLAIEMENAVSRNSAGDIINLVNAGGDANGLTQSGESLLHFAASTGNCDSIAALGFLKADMDIINSTFSTPLEVAVRNDNAQSIKALLMAGAKIDKKLYRGDTYLHIAAAGGQCRAMIALLEGGLKINAKNHLDETPLFQAVRKGNISGVEVLLQKGADVSIIPKTSKSLVEIVIESKNVAMFKVFMKWDNLTVFHSEEGDSLSHLVAISGNAEMFKILKDQKLSVNIKNKNGITPLHVASDIPIIKMLLGMGLFVDEKDNTGCTSLMSAIKNAKPEIVTFLLHNGANPNIKDNDHITPLHLAAEKGHVEIVIALLDAGARMEEKDSKGMTPAFSAALGNKLNVLELLVEHGADMSIRDSNDEGMIHLVARLGYSEIVSLLLGAGVMVDMKGIGERTALHYAAEEGHASVVSVLLDHGAAINAMTNIITEASAPVHTIGFDNSASFNDIAVFSCPPVVTSYGHYGSVASFGNRRCNSRWTPLIAASKIGNLDIVKLLILKGANINDRDTVSNKTALGWAVNNQHTSVADYLKLAGGTQ